MGRLSAPALPDVALLSGQRLRTGAFAIRAWHGAREVLEERGVPYVLVQPPVARGMYRTNPVDLVRGWEHSQADVQMLQTGEHRQAAKDLVWAWVHSDDAPFRRPWCRAHVYASSIIVNDAAMATWAPKLRVVLLRKRRYALNTFRRIMRDAIRDALTSHDVAVREVAPAFSNVYVGPSMLVGAWEREGWRVS